MYCTVQKLLFSISLLLLPRSQSNIGIYLYEKQIVPPLPYNPSQRPYTLALFCMRMRQCCGSRYVQSYNHYNYSNIHSQNALLCPTANEKGPCHSEFALGWDYIHVCCPAKHTANRKRGQLFTLQSL
jgi:hypothetical protein